MRSDGVDADVRADVVVVTALEFEYAAVRAHLTGLHAHTDANGTRYETGQSRGGRCRVALAVTGPGNLAAAALATHAITRFRPKALILVGVAGGLAREVELGDVVVATRVHAYHGGRADSGGFRPRPKSWPLSHGLGQDARDVARGDVWTRLLPGEVRDTPPAVHLKPLVSGEVVLDARDGLIARLIEEHYNDAVAIDMESAGVAEAAHHNDFHQTITVRAISDLADGSKRNTDAAGWRHRAATHAAAFAIALAERIASGPGSTRIPTGYRRHVESIAPERLLDRAAELAELAGFATGDVPYAWWQAGPWAGKSALMSWFVLHPPEDVDVVSFFVTGRLAAQEDSDAFTKELVLQLAALTGERLPNALSFDDRRNQLWRLLDEAGTRSGRLLVVIDGLDEDTGPAHGKPSIASLLPRHPPPNVRILVAGRPDPPVPDDVLDDDHPLLTCPRRQLAPSPHARSMERRAVNELTQHLRGDDLHRDVLGLITASGGGLTRGDLERLTGRPPYEIDRLLDGPLGRTIGSRPAPLRPGENEPVHLFAHETLAETARAKFGASARSYQARIHTWADSYREKGWPPYTPRYLLVGYPHMLADAGDHDRLVALATDQTRHDRMLRTSGGDALAANEVRLAQELLCHQPAPNLSALLLLAAHVDELTNRDSHLLVRLPLVWMTLGDTARAEALARGIPQPEPRAAGLTALAGFAARTGDHERLDALVTEIRTLVGGFPFPYDRETAIRELAETVATAGDPALAISIAQDVPEGYARERLLTDLTATDGDDEQAPPPVQTDEASEFVRNAVAADEYEHALTLALEDPDPARQATAVAKVATAAWANGDHGRAASLFEVAVTRARRIEDAPVERAGAAITVVETAGSGGAVAPAAVLDDVRETLRALSGKDLLESMARLAVAAASVGDQDRAHALFVESGRLLDTVDDTSVRDRAMRRWVLPSAFAAGEYDWALARVNAFTDPDEQAMATAELVDAVADSADRDRLSSLLTDAAALVRSGFSSYAAGVVLTRLAVAAAGIGEHERALALANDIADGAARDRALTDLATAAVGDGDLERALSTVRRITDEGAQRKTLAKLAEAASIAGDRDQALLLVDLCRDVDARRNTVKTLAVRAARDGEHEWARALASAITEASYRADVQERLASTAVADGAWDQAVAVINDMAGDRLRQADALTVLVVAVAAAGDPDRARNLAVDIAGAVDLPEVLTRLARSAAEAGDRSRVRALLTEAVAGSAHHHGLVLRSHVLAQAVEVAVAAGELDHAHALARDIVNPYSQIHAFTQLAEATAEAGDHDTARDLAVRVETITRNLHDATEPEAITALAVASLLIGDRDRAHRLTRGIPDGDDRIRTLEQLALADPDAAPALLTDAVAAADTIPHLRDRAAALSRLVRTAGAVGQPDLLRSLLTHAEAVTAAVEEVPARAYLLAFLAQAAAGAGQLDAARSLLAAAESLAAAMPDSGGSAYPRRLIATTLDFDLDRTLHYELTTTAIATGEHDRARVLANGLADPAERHRALTALALAAREAGDHELAMDVVRDIDGYLHRHMTLEALIEQATARGDHDQARSFASITARGWEQADTLTWLAQVATATGDHPRALSLVKTIPEGHSRTAGLAWLVRAAVAAGDHGRARTLAAQLRERDRKEAERYLSGETPAVPGLYSDNHRAESMVDTLIAAGNHEAAVTIARDIARDIARGSPSEIGTELRLAKLVDAELATGDHDRALAAARKITDPQPRADALSRVAEAAAAAGDPARARSALAEVLVLARWWYESAKLVARVAPDALAAVLDELESRCGVPS